MVIYGITSITTGDSLFMQTRGKGFQPFFFQNVSSQIDEVNRKDEINVKIVGRCWPAKQHFILK